MISQTTAQSRFVGRARPEEISSLGRCDSPEIKAPNCKWQARNTARRLCALYRLGEYPLFHFITEIERGGRIDEALEIYAALPRDFIAALGGRDFPPSVRSIDGSAP
jgi:hypothetical protein